MIWRKFVSWHHRLERIPGIQRHEIDRLRPKHRDQDVLQAALDSSAESPAILRVANVAQLDSKRVAELLGASLRESAEPLSRGWLSRHWADLLILAGVTFLAMLPKFGGIADDGIRARAEDRAAKPHAVAKRDLLPYIPLEPGDLQSKNVKLQDEASKLIAGFVGRYPKQLIQKGKTVTTTSLSENKAGLNHFSVLRVSLKLRPALEGRSFPSSADLLLSARSASPAGAVFSVLLLNLEGDGLTATVAIPDVNVNEATRWIGSSDAYLTFSVP